MRKHIKKKESKERKYLREFVDSVMSKDFAAANDRLALVVKEKIKRRISTSLQES